MPSAISRSSFSTLVALVVLFAAAAAPPALRGQQAGDVPVVELRVWANGETFLHAQLDSPTSLDAAIADAVVSVQRKGYIYAEIDSTHRSGEGSVDAYADLGQRVRISDVTLGSDSDLDRAAFENLTGLRSGDYLDLDKLEEGAQNFAEHLAREGNPLVRVSIEDITFVSPEEVNVSMQVVEGAQVILGTARIVGGDRTRGSYVMRLANLRAGQPLPRFDPVDIQRRLRESGNFEEVHLPQLVTRRDSVDIVIRLVEEPPGSFDLALGYLPDATGGALVGSGHLELRNPFGDGRWFSINLDRLPGHTSSLAAEVGDPFVLGTPMRAALSLEAYQQDSLFHRQRFGAEAGYRLQGGLELFALGSSEASRPGTAGVRIQAGRQRIARSDALMIGAGVRMARLDFTRSPSRGLAIEATAERGRNRRSQDRVVAADTLREYRSVSQDRVNVMIRTFLPVMSRGVFVSGLDVRSILSDEYDRSSFYRIGGLRTLRGYDDDRFLTRFSARGVAEYRYRLDRISYLLAFVDFAYLERPDLPDLEAMAAWRLGYGAGAQFDTGFSLINFVVAANPEDGIVSPRVHVGVSFGL